jgi:hypothetical protein
MPVGQVEGEDSDLWYPSEDEGEMQRYSRPAQGGEIEGPPAAESDMISVGLIYTHDHHQSTHSEGHGVFTPPTNLKLRSVLTALRLTGSLLQRFSLSSRTGTVERGLGLLRYSTGEHHTHG